MSVRVELIDEAIADLQGYVKSGRIRDFLQKLLHIEEYGAEAGLPLGKGLSTYRKMIVGNKDWRIVFKADDETATVLVIGDRSDSQCYDDAEARLQGLSGNAKLKSLAEALALLVKDQSGKKKKR